MAATSPKSRAREWWPFRFQPPAFPAENNSQHWCGCHWIFHTKAPLPCSVAVTHANISFLPSGSRNLWGCFWALGKTSILARLSSKKSFGSEWCFIPLACGFLPIQRPGSRDAHEQDKLFKVLFHVTFGCRVSACKNYSHTSYWCKVRAEVFLLSLVGGWLRGEACVAQGELLALLQGFIICWKMLGKYVINTSGEGFGKGRYREDRLCVWQSVYFMTVCVCKEQVKSLKWLPFLL